MGYVSERLPEPFGDIDELVFGPAPAEVAGFELWDIYREVMRDWAGEIPAARVADLPHLAQCKHVLRRHGHTDPDTGVTKEDYITRELHEEGIA
jgi:hypothetical protein